MRILIVGAGIGGLTAALALTRDGHDVEVYEQAPRLAELGAGVQISANGARVLFALGLEDAIRNVWCVPSAKEIRLWNTGETWKLFDLGAESVARYGAPYFMIHRADLHGVLIDAVRALKPDAIRLNARCTGFESDDSAVTLHLGDGERIAGDALIGADGVHSRIRNRLVGDDKPEFTGCMAWRGLVPVETLPPHMRRNVGVNWVGPGGHVINYQLRRGEIFNFVGVVERDWRVESWTEKGSTRGMRRGFRRLARRHPRDHPQHRPAVQMGAARPRAADTIVSWPRDIARRCRAPDIADAGAGRQHGDRGRIRAGALPCRIRRR